MAVVVLFAMDSMTTITNDDQAIIRKAFAEAIATAIETLAAAIITIIAIVTTIATTIEAVTVESGNRESAIPKTVIIAHRFYTSLNA